MSCSLTEAESSLLTWIHPRANHLDGGIVTRQLSQLPLSPAVASSESLNL